MDNETKNAIRGLIVVLLIYVSAYVFFGDIMLVVLAPFLIPCWFLISSTLDEREHRMRKIGEDTIPSK
jgi:hypothetical protein